MLKRLVAEVFVVAFMLVWTPNLRLNRTTDVYATDIVVPDQYSTIQAAINNAVDGDMIFVKSGTYFEHVVVNKTVSLVGEDSRTTVVDANGSGRVFSISRDYVNITGFTTRKSGGVYAQDAGVWIEGAGHCSIFGNNVTENDFFGISVWESSSNNITGNIVSKTKVMGRPSVFRATYAVLELVIVRVHPIVFRISIGGGTRKRRKTNGTVSAFSVSGLKSARIKPVAKMGRDAR